MKNEKERFECQKLAKSAVRNQWLDIMSAMRIMSPNVALIQICKECVPLPAAG